jgi:predicted phosphatase
VVTEQQRVLVIPVMVVLVVVKPTPSAWRVLVQLVRAMMEAKRQVQVVPLVVVVRVR